MRHVPRAALLAAVLVLIGSSAAHSAPLIQFHTPSDNIGCAMSDDADLGAFVRCDIDERSWPLPPRPKGQACEELDFGGSLGLGKKGKGHFICAGDTTLHQGKTLEYDHARKVGRFTCWSRTSGVTCRNRRNGHGFFISRNSYRRF